MSKEERYLLRIKQAMAEEPAGVFSICVVHDNACPGQTDGAGCICGPEMTMVNVLNGRAYALDEIEDKWKPMS